MYQAICSDIDVLGKYIASEIDSSFSRVDKYDILKWWIKIQNYNSLYLPIEKYNNPSISPVKLYDAKVHNYLLDEDFEPWNNFVVESYVDARGRSRIRCCSGSNVPSWWSSYNKVKHHRTERDGSGNINYSKANLKNICEAISALYILEMLALEISIDNKSQYETFMNESKLFNTLVFASSEDIASLFNR